MKICVYFFLGCLAQAAANAADFDHSFAMTSDQTATITRFLGPPGLTKDVLKSIQAERSAYGRRPNRDQSGRPVELQLHEPAFAVSLENAWKKGIIELGVEANYEVLAQCQKEQSPTLTLPFMRSDGQQDHCFRF